MVKALFNKEATIMTNQIVSYKTTIEKQSRLMAELQNKIKWLENEAERLYVENGKLKMELYDCQEGEVVIRTKKVKVKRYESSTDRTCE